MSTSNDYIFFSISYIIITILAFIFIFIYESDISKLKKEAIEYGYAQYNPTTAKFEWIKNKE